MGTVHASSGGDMRHTLRLCNLYRAHPSRWGGLFKASLSPARSRQLHCGHLPPLCCCACNILAASSPAKKFDNVTFETTLALWRKYPCFCHLAVFAHHFRTRIAHLRATFLLLPPPNVNLTFEGDIFFSIGQQLRHFRKVRTAHANMHHHKWMFWLCFEGAGCFSAVFQLLVQTHLYFSSSLMPKLS